jgi:anaerobic selenocysteine-containing dehydrogenase
LGFRNWTNGPLLVRADNGQFLREKDVLTTGDTEKYIAWDATKTRPVAYDPGRGSYAADNAKLALFGSFEVETLRSTVTCRPAFQLTADVCARYDPKEVERITGVDAEQVTQAAQMLWDARPVAYMAWSGVEQQSNATQIPRAIGLVYALTGNFDAKGGNVLFPTVPNANILGDDMLSAEQRAKTLGLADRPLGPSRFDHVTSGEIYRAILDHQPYAVRGLVSFGSNLLVAHADGERGRRALAALDFHVHADHFMNPSAEMADIVLPTTSPFESEGLKLGFEISKAACSLIQLRKKLVEPRGEARSDIQIIFDLACRLGFGQHFWDGDIDAAYRHQLAPSGVTLETLRENPAGVKVPLETRYQKYAEYIDEVPRGFDTPSRKVELYSETFLNHGYSPLPDYEEPLVGPHSRPHLAARYPLVLTCTKGSIFCESQHRGLPNLRRRCLDPQVELHPEAAAARDISSGDWVSIETPNGRVRARAQFNDALDPQVVCGQHGWWQACPEIGAPGYDPFGLDSANFNLIINDECTDPVSGSVPLRAYICEIERLT